MSPEKLAGRCLQLVIWWPRWTPLLAVVSTLFELSGVASRMVLPAEFQEHAGEDFFDDSTRALIPTEDAAECHTCSVFFALFFTLFFSAEFASAQRANPKYRVLAFVPPSASAATPGRGRTGTTLATGARCRAAEHPD